MRIARAVKSGLLAVMIAGAASAQGGAAAPQTQDGSPAAPPNSSQASGTPANPNSGGWHRIGEPSPAAPLPGPGQGQPQGPGAGAPIPPLPSQLTIPAGTFLTIRVNQELSSDRNHQGDPFLATLISPIVVNGRVVAERGQTIAGTVVEAKKAGLLHGSSHLGLQVTEMTLADGQQTPVQTSFISRYGPNTGGHNAAVMGTTTAVGASVGAMAAGGVGAAAGAGAGLAAGTLGVLLTPGYPTVVFPEQVLTFRTETPVVISTERAPQAFRPVGPQDYQQPGYEPRLQTRPPVRPHYRPAYVYGPYPYYGYPGYFGPGIGFGIGFGHIW